MPFELRPYPNPTLRPEGDYLQRAWQQSVYPIARRMGVEIKLPQVSPQPHTHLAFEGYQYAKQHGKGNEYNYRVLKAFFVEGQDIGQIDVLTRLAGEIGLNQEEFEEALRTRKCRETHQRALRHAYEEAGVTGVPPNTGRAGGGFWKVSCRGRGFTTFWVSWRNRPGATWQLLQMIERAGQPSAANLTSTDPGIDPRFSMNQAGQIEGRYALQNFDSPGQPTLSGVFQMDQSYLPGLLAQVVKLLQPEA